MKAIIEPSSFKDPSGFVFSYKGRVFRQINSIYKDDYKKLMSSGLYEKLVGSNLLVAHKEVSDHHTDAQSFKVIEPQKVPFISYPYEWCFSQLKDAALVTLTIQKIALRYGMSLKDASSFNIQFIDGKPILIDTLSFETYQEGKPWVAYEQFCQQFLAPLALFSSRDERLRFILQANMGSVPLDLAVKLLPLRIFTKPALFLHLFLHSKEKKSLTKSQDKTKLRANFSKHAFLELIDSLEGAVRSLRSPVSKTFWADYYAEYGQENYHDPMLRQKKSLVGKYIHLVKPSLVWDIGANTGLFSRVAAKEGALTISADNDTMAVEKNYQEVREKSEKNILPLYLDFMNPTPSLGWASEERASFFSRKHPDTILFLALIHHVAIGSNLPLSKLARFLSSLCTSLIIEFVPKEDHQVQSLLAFRKDIFIGYDKKSFEKEFEKFFTIEKKSVLEGTNRILYLMKVKK